MGKEQVSPQEDMIPPWPQTPEEREAIPDYGDLVSTIIWYPENVVRCRNCNGEFKDHNPDTGSCPDHGTMTFGLFAQSRR